MARFVVFLPFLLMCNLLVLCNALDVFDDYDLTTTPATTTSNPNQIKFFRSNTYIFDDTSVVKVLKTEDTVISTTTTEEPLNGDASGALLEDPSARLLDALDSNDIGNMTASMDTSTPEVILEIVDDEQTSIGEPIPPIMVASDMGKKRRKRFTPSGN